MYVQIQLASAFSLLLFHKVLLRVSSGVVNLKMVAAQKYAFSGTPFKSLIRQWSALFLHLGFFCPFLPHHYKTKVARSHTVL